MLSWAMTTAKKLKGKKKQTAEPLTFRGMRQIGLGQLRLSPSAFYELTVAELLDAMRGAAEVEERAYRQQWAQQRWLAHLLLQPHSKQRLKPEDLGIFPWEQAGSKSKKEREANNELQIKQLQKIFRNGTA